MDLEDDARDNLSGGEAMDYDDDEDDGLGHIPEAVEVPERGRGGTATGGEGDQEGEGAAAAAEGAETKKKRVIRNPQPKLDPDRICGPRGIGILEQTFQDFKPKGKGREFDDLDSVLRRMEHWAHRLYPRLPFDDVMDRVSQLGKKNAVKNYVRKVRLNMVDPSASVDAGGGAEAREGGGADDDDNVERYETGEPEEDAFARLMRQAEEVERRQSLERDEEEEAMLAAVGASQARSPRAGGGAAMSEEAKERMERNRRLAVERRTRAARAAEERMQSQADKEEEAVSQIEEQQGDEGAQSGGKAEDQTPVERMQEQADSTLDDEGMESNEKEGEDGAQDAIAGNDAGMDRSDAADDQTLVSKEC